MRSSVEVHDIEIIRGDSFTSTVGLGSEYSDTIAAADDFLARLVIRERQDDTAPELLVMTSDILPNSDPAYPDVEGLLHFEASSLETQLLPPYDLVCFCEIVGYDGLYRRRLFQGRTSVGD